MPDELKNVDTFIASQCSGWMTNKLFTAFVVYFVATMSTYRLELPAELQDKTIYLLVDNRPSRCNSTAVEFLANHNIKIITFPGHCTYVMQPYDVGVASTFKLNMSSFRLSNSVREKASSLNDTAKARYLTVSSIINAWNSIPFEILQKSFETTGICPFNPNVPINNPLTNKNETATGPKRRGGISISNQELTSDQNRLLLYNYEKETQLINVNQIPQIHFFIIRRYLSAFNERKGFILSKYPALIVKCPDGSYKNEL